jgi:hypothetical protein
VAPAGPADLRQPPPPRLYHYTALEALRGIVEDRSLWASSPLYLNDRKELAHARDLMAAQVAARLDAAAGDASFLRELATWLDEAPYLDPLVFTCSFSDDGNLLSQWRAYGQPGRGISLGFDTAPLCPLAEAQGFRLLPCIYDPDAQQALIAQALDALCDAAARDDSPQPPARRHAGLLARHSERMLELSAVLKHPSFREEREWRLVCTLPTDPRDRSVEYRVGDGALVPFRRVRLVRDEREPLTIARVVIGPTPILAQARASRAAYLAREGVRVGELQVSGVPLRE